MTTQLSLDLPSEKLHHPLTEEGYEKYSYGELPEQIPDGHYSIKIGLHIQIRPYEAWLYKRLIRALKEAGKPLDISSLRRAINGTNNITPELNVDVRHIVKHLDELHKSGKVKVAKQYFGSKAVGPNYLGFTHLWSWSK